MEYIAPDYIKENGGKLDYGPVKLVNGKVPGGYKEAAAYILKNVYGLRGIRVIAEPMSALAKAGGMESSNAFTISLLAAGSMLRGANLTEADLFALSVKLENDELNGLTGGQGQLAALFGGGYQHMWLSGMELAGADRGKYGAFTIPLLSDEQLENLGEHALLVQPGISYDEKGNKIIPRLASTTNKMWTDLLRDRDIEGFKKHMRKLALTERYAKGLTKGDFVAVEETTNEYVDIRDELVQRWLSLAVAAKAAIEKGVPNLVPAYTLKYGYLLMTYSELDVLHKAMGDDEFLVKKFNDKMNEWRQVFP